MALTARSAAHGFDRESSAADERPYERLARKIAALIARGELAAGERVPSERELAERYRVSRTAIREAIIALEIRGLVEVRPASGIYVRAVEPSSLTTKGSAGPFELLRSRLVIEPPICAAAAVSAKDSDLDAVYAAIVAMTQTLNDKRANDAADKAFQVAIAAATGNGILTEIVGAIWDRRHGPMREKTE
jgi:DNA-binding FadR family transcriptional regulator